MKFYGDQPVILSALMTVPDSNTPKFKEYKEGELIPPVDPEDIKRTWEYDRTHSKVGANGWEWMQARQAVCSPGADASDVSSRYQMIETLIRLKLIEPWQRGDELHDAVFRIAATIQFRVLKIRDYKIGGDELYGFDPNRFVPQLVDETGVAHVWEPVKTKLAPGQRAFVLGRRVGSAPSHDDPDLVAKRSARRLLWHIWTRFADLRKLLDQADKEQAPEMAATFFADFVIDNLDLFREVEAGFKAGNYGGGLPVLIELEQRAQRWPGSATVL